MEGSPTVSRGEAWGIGFLLAACVNYFSQQFNKTSLDEFIIVIVAVSAGVLYHKVKPRLSIKSGGWAGVAAFFILLFGSAAVIGALRVFARVFMFI
ncbi:MAG: hypothetical protein NUV59_02405 [Patescibacteria group bacterium]|nr:hypothetical protein [Patescibacteria group bacterium]